jgi:uncharacterized protein YyaL (SSP411 family)
MLHPMGGYFSAEDADSLPEAGSDGKLEGAFCVWTKEEMTNLLGGYKIGVSEQTFSWRHNVC